MKTSRKVALLGVASVVLIAVASLSFSNGSGVTHLSLTISISGVSASIGRFGISGQTGQDPSVEAVASPSGAGPLTGAGTCSAAIGGVSVCHITVPQDGAVMVLLNITMANPPTSCSYTQDCYGISPNFDLVQGNVMVVFPPHGFGWGDGCFGAVGGWPRSYSFYIVAFSGGASEADISFASCNQ